MYFFVAAYSISPKLVWDILQLTTAAADFDFSILENCFIPDDEICNVPHKSLSFPDTENNLVLLKNFAFEKPSNTPPLQKQEPSVSPKMVRDFLQPTAAAAPRGDDCMKCESEAARYLINSEKPLKLFINF